MSWSSKNIFYLWKKKILVILGLLFSIYGVFKDDILRFNSKIPRLDRSLILQFI